MEEEAMVEAQAGETATAEVILTQGQGTVKAAHTHRVHQTEDTALTGQEGVISASDIQRR